jgi:hypothetical protein
LINIALSLAAVIDAFARNMMIDEAPGTSKSRDEPKDPAIAHAGRRGAVILLPQSRC